MRSGERKLKPEEMAGGSALTPQPEEWRWGSLRVSEGSSRRGALSEPHCQQRFPRCLIPTLRAGGPLTRLGGSWKLVESGGRSEEHRVEMGLLWTYRRGFKVCLCRAKPSLPAGAMGLHAACSGV